MNAPIRSRAISVICALAVLWYIGDEILAQQAPASATFEVGSDAPVSDAPSLFTAVEEQLGLKLESTQAPVSVVVIDHVERPTPN